jgi:hypothetical protein
MVASTRRWDADGHDLVAGWFRTGGSPSASPRWEPHPERIDLGLGEQVLAVGAAEADVVAPCGCLNRVPVATKLCDKLPG